MGRERRKGRRGERKRKGARESGRIRGGGICSVNLRGIEALSEGTIDRA